MSMQVIDIREEIHDDQGRNAVKSVPVYRVRYVEKPSKYKKEQAQ